MKRDDYVIGIVGGMGSWATADLFERILLAFPAPKEWDRPRILIDNRCTMPSRVRAILYGEREDELVHSLAGSIQGLARMGAARIVLACNTSHVFLPKVAALCPDDMPKVLHILRALGEDLRTAGISRVSLLATEGTILSGIYVDTLSEYGVEVLQPDEAQFTALRDFIEAVKLRQIDRETCERFIRFIDSRETGAVVLGCTELPILYRRCLESGLVPERQIFDPLQSVLDRLVREYGETEA